MKISVESLFDNTEVAFQDKSDKDLRKRHWFFSLVQSEDLVAAGASLTEFAMKIGLPVSYIFKHTVFDLFVGGETLQKTEATIHQLAANGVDSLINYGVEAEDSENDYDMTIQKNLEAIDFAKDSLYVKGVCVKITGFGRFDLFEKLQKGDSLKSEEKEEFNRVLNRLDLLCQKASNSNVVLYVDAEEYWIQNVLDEMVLNMMRKYNKQTCVLSDTFQLYRWDQLAYLEKLINMSKQEGFILGAKLVRGAYMEKERERAKNLNYRSPIHDTKAEVDRDFNNAISSCLQNLNNVSVCVSSHNEKSCVHLVNQVENLGIEKSHPHLYISQLYGMGDHISYNLARIGFNATKYLPYGPVKNIIPYLIRRASENTSVHGQMSRELTLIKKEIKRRKGIS